MYLKTLVLLVAAALAASAQMDKIEAERIRAHVRFLSDDLLEGRAPGDARVTPWRRATLPRRWRRRG
jgi:hypothetical protein